MSDDLETLLDRLAQDDAPAPSNGHTSTELMVEPELSILPMSAGIETAPVLDVREHIRRHEAISDEILSSWRADREEAQSAINTIRDIIDDFTVKGQTPSGTVLEAYVGAIKAKIDTNATAAKLLDTTSRLIQVTKPTVNIKQTNTTNYNDLTTILNNPIGLMTYELQQVGADRMSTINPQQALQGKPPAWVRAVSRLPELLQKEILDERPDPDQQEIHWISSWQVGTQPVDYQITQLLRHRENLAAIARTPPDVIREINRKWRLQVRPGQMLDPTAGRYKEYAKKFTGASAKPSVMVNGELVFGVGRFIAALLRGDQQLKVWDIKANAVG